MRYLSLLLLALALTACSDERVVTTTHSERGVRVSIPAGDPYYRLVNGRIKESCVSTEHIILEVPPPRAR